MASELIEASRQNYLGIVRLLLLDQGTNPNLQNTAGQTALMWASYHSHIDMVWLLLDYGADSNLQDKRGQTALMFASRLGHTDVVRELLDRGADLNLQTYKYGQTALMFASRLGHTDVVKLLEAYAGWNLNVVQPLMDLDIFPEGLIREHLTV
jgi:ankyrin repeat protein